MGVKMKKLLVGMWLMMAALIGLTVFLIFRPSAIFERFEYVPKSELLKAQADGQAATQAAVAAKELELARQLAEASRQVAQRQDQVQRIAIERLDLANTMADERAAASQSRRLTVALLLSALDHEAATVRAWGAAAASELDAPITEAVPKLTELLKDQDEQVRQAAQKSLMRLSVPSKESP
jgi:hypothetical protein